MKFSDWSDSDNFKDLVSEEEKKQGWSFEVGFFTE